MQRRADARVGKSQIEGDLRNCYYFAAPRRARQMSSAAGAQSKPGDDRNLQTSIGFEVSDDFMTMLIETFTPREGWWAERRMPTEPDEDGEENPDIVEWNKAIRAEDKKIFDLIRGSNYYAEKAKAGVPDAAVGLLGLLIDSPGRGKPVQCLGIPIREIDIELGPDGRIDFRSITRPTKYRHVKPLLGKEISGRLPNEIAKKIKEKPDERVEISWMWWRNWENENDVEWKRVVLVDDKRVDDGELIGEGACPFVVGRFGATPDYAWPDGPLIKSLANLAQIDELRAALIDNVDFTLRPPKAYEDDGTINLPADGLEPGTFVPKRPSGGRPAFEDIYEPRPIEAAMFELSGLVEAVRRLHYVDFPEQKGKTPPTATQWIDELVIRQRRIGTPGFAYWREEPYETFQRFRYLGERMGKVRRIEEIGVPGGISLQPYNPAERAQDSQEVQTAVRFAEIGQAVAPTMWQVMNDEAKTLANLKAKMRDEIIALRPAEEAAERIRLLASLGEQALAAGIGQQRSGGEEQ
jgi:hypothetical protein